MMQTSEAASETEEALQRYYYQKVFWKYAGNLQENTICALGYQTPFKNTTPSIFPRPPPALNLQAVQAPFFKEIPPSISVFHELHP